MALFCPAAFKLSLFTGLQALLGNELKKRALHALSPPSRRPPPPTRRRLIHTTYFSPIRQFQAGSRRLHATRRPCSTQSTVAALETDTNGQDEPSPRVYDELVSPPCTQAETRQVSRPSNRSISETDGTVGDENREAQIQQSAKPTPNTGISTGKIQPSSKTDSDHNRATNNNKGKDKDKNHRKRAPTSPRTAHKRELWQIQKNALKDKFKEGWNPHKKLSPDAIDGIRHLHATAPDRFTTPVLAEHFKISPEAIRRILKSKWQPTEEERDRRRKRWHKRRDRIWSQMAELGLRPKRKRTDKVVDVNILYDDATK